MRYSRDDGLFYPGESLCAGGDVIARWKVPLVGPVVEYARQHEEAFDGRAVLVGHEVVENRVNWGTEVKQDHGSHIKILTEAGGVIVIHVCEEESADVVGQPADGKHQHNNSYRKEWGF